MFLKKLQLFQFKNHQETNLNFDNPVICFVGNNGVGKTNILDAIHYLSITKSYFNYIDGENVKFDSQYFNIKGSFEKNNNLHEIECNYHIGKKKVIKLNNKKYLRFSEHIGAFPIIIISPTDTNLISENSDVRRKYLDSTIAMYNTSYLQVLIKYNKALKQRNFLLKKYAESGIYDNISLELYEKQLINNGNVLFEERKKFMSQFVPVFKKYYDEISNLNEGVSLEYSSQLYNSSFSELIYNNINKDKLSKKTQCGIHKDDILFKMDNHLIKKTGSQGQQKSFLISLKLAQFDFIKKKVNFKPILLLDDIFDKLDNERIFKIINLVNKDVFGQVFITDTNEERSKEILNKAEISYKIFNIDNINCK